jgi:hypothetical protein
MFPDPEGWLGGWYESLRGNCKHRLRSARRQWLVVTQPARGVAVLLLEGKFVLWPPTRKVFRSKDDRICKVWQPQAQTQLPANGKFHMVAGESNLHMLRHVTRPAQRLTKSHQKSKSARGCVLSHAKRLRLSMILLRPQLPAASSSIASLREFSAVFLSVGSH